MGKSIRSKRLKRLRTLKRELVTPHYDEKELAKMAAQEAAMAAPKLELNKKRSQIDSMETEELTRGRTGQTSMAVDEVVVSTSGNDTTSKVLRARGGIKKRGKSQGRLKKERHHKQKLHF